MCCQQRINFSKGNILCLLLPEEPRWLLLASHGVQFPCLYPLAPRLLQTPTLGSGTEGNEDTAWGLPIWGCPLATVRPELGPGQSSD